MSKIEHPLKSVALKVLEDWAMMLVDEEIEPHADIFSANGPVYLSQVELHGVIEGALTIAAPKRFTSILASNVLGQDESQPPEEQDCEDAFREMGNILAGNFITEAYGVDTVFDLLKPTVSTIELDSLRRHLDRNIVYQFIADEMPVAVWFNLTKN